MASKYLSSFVINDFETGGFDSDKDAVTEWAGIAITGDTLEEVARDCMYAQYGYSPSLKYGEKALDITGIKIEDLIAEGIPIKEFVDRIIGLFEKALAACKGAHQKPILVGHNYAFDRAFLQACFDYAKKDISKYIAGKKDHYGNFQPDYIDTVHLSKMKWQDDDTMENYKLGTCIEKAGLELNDAHRAINDVIGNTELFKGFIQDFRFFGDGGSSGEGVQSKKSRQRTHYQF